jgi:hypothetical protein
MPTLENDAAPIVLARPFEAENEVQATDMSPIRFALYLQRERATEVEVGGATAKGRPQHRRGFAAKCAEHLRVDKSTITRALMRVAALGDRLAELADTSLDVGLELDALIKLTPGERTPLMEQAVGGGNVSARATLAALVEPDFARRKLEEIDRALWHWRNWTPTAADRARERLGFTPISKLETARLETEREIIVARIAGGANHPGTKSRLRLAQP